jgi:hypothetical protein
VQIPSDNKTATLALVVGWSVSTARIPYRVTPNQVIDRIGLPGADLLVQHINVSGQELSEADLLAVRPNAVKAAAYPNEWFV